MPDEMWDDTAKKFKNVWGGSAYLTANTKSAEDSDNNRAFAIQIDEIPEEVCIELLSHDWTASGMVAIWTDTSSKGEVIAKVPLSVDIATNFCADNTYDDNRGETIFLFDVDWNYWSDGIYIYE